MKFLQCKYTIKNNKPENQVVKKSKNRGNEI